MLHFLLNLNLNKYKNSFSLFIWCYLLNNFSFVSTFLVNIYVFFNKNTQFFIVFSLFSILLLRISYCAFVFQWKFSILIKNFVQVSNLKPYYHWKVPHVKISHFSIQKTILCNGCIFFNYFYLASVSLNIFLEKKMFFIKYNIHLIIFIFIFWLLYLYIIYISLSIIQQKNTYFQLQLKHIHTYTSHNFICAYQCKK